MFCPRCRRHWQSEDSPVLLPSGRNKPSRSCPVCQTLLAPDRLAAEFPASEETALSSCLTVQDVLREAAASPAIGSQTPLDEQMKRFRKSLWEHDHDSDSSLPGASRRMGGSTPVLYLVLGFGSLLAIVFLVVGVFVHTIWQGGAETHPEKQPLSEIGHAAASPSEASALGVLSGGIAAPASARGQKTASRPRPKARISLLPAAVGRWRLWNNGRGASAAGGFDSPGGHATLAYYQRGGSLAQISLVRVSGSKAPAKAVIAYAGSPRTVSGPGGAKNVRPYSKVWDGRKCLFFDDRQPAQDTGWRVFTSSPYVPDSPHTVSWYQAPYVVTVGADTVSERNSFARAYLAKEAR